MINTVLRTLINFANNPNDSWGEPTDGNGNRADIRTGKQIRVPIEQADRNTARLNSGAYTKEQYNDFMHQLGLVEHRGGTAYFGGDPNNLPVNIPKRACPCGKTFRSSRTEEVVSCYECNLDRLCPVLPGQHINAYWHRDEWSLQAFGDIGFHNEMSFWWHNSNSGGNVCHQGLVVSRNAKGDIGKIVFSTIAAESHKCYTVTFKPVEKTVKYALYNSYSVNIDEFARSVELKELDSMVIDLMVAMLPSWMLYKHRPRNPVNGCFA